MGGIYQTTVIVRSGTPIRVVQSPLTMETLEGKTAGAKDSLNSCRVRVPSRVASKESP